MKKSNYKILLLMVAMALCRPVIAQQPAIIKWNSLEALLNPDSDTTYVINFWATWCKPCIKELPYFDLLESEFPGRKLRVILVSLDFKRQFETTLKPYLSKNNITAEVFLIDEPDYNEWIDKVDKTWNGAIPATIIINKATGTRKFYEREFTKEELKDTVKPLLP